jgi:CRISPR system Cascade subunit CasB
MNDPSTDSATDPALHAAPPRTAFERRTRAVQRLRYSIEKESDPGTLAALRRMRPELPPPVFFRITIDKDGSGILDDVLPRDPEARLEAESLWALVTQAMAMAVSHGTSLLSRTSLGEALARADVAELRVLRLLNARGDQRFSVVRGIVHQLVARGERFNPEDLAHLLLSDEDGAEPTRRRIASSFYRHH